MTDEDWTSYRKAMALETGRPEEGISEDEVWAWCIEGHAAALAELPPKVWPGMAAIKLPHKVTLDDLQERQAETAQEYREAEGGVYQ